MNTIDKLRELVRLVDEAKSGGRELEYRDVKNNSGWIPVASGIYSLDAIQYLEGKIEIRVRPAPSLLPWTVFEARGRWVRLKKEKDGNCYQINHTALGCVFFGSEGRTMEWLLDDCEEVIDETHTGPCGVEQTK